MSGRFLVILDALGCHLKSNNYILLGNIPIFEELPVVLIKLLIDHPGGQMAHFMRKSIPDSL